MSLTPTAPIPDWKGMFPDINEKYSNLLQSHHTLCGEIEQKNAYIQELSDAVEDLRKQRDAALLQAGKAAEAELNRWIHALKDLGFTVHPGVSVPENLVDFAEWWKDRKAIKKQNGLDAHGNIEHGLRCSKSGCDELATCKKCFGCGAHCTEKRKCEHKWLHIEDAHYFCPLCKATEDR